MICPPPSSKHPSRALLPAAAHPARHAPCSSSSLPQPPPTCFLFASSALASSSSSSRYGLTKMVAPVILISCTRSAIRAQRQAGCEGPWSAALAVQVDSSSSGRRSSKCSSRCSGCSRCSGSSGRRSSGRRSSSPPAAGGRLRRWAPSPSASAHQSLLVFWGGGDELKRSSYQLVGTFSTRVSTSKPELIEA